MTSGSFKSPICGHEISTVEFEYSDWVTCVCGAKYNALTVRAFVAQKDATDAAYFAFEKQRNLYDKIFNTLKAELNGTKSKGGAAVAPATVSAAPASSAAPVPAPASVLVTAEPKNQAEAPAPKMHRPKRAPFSPRTLMLLVAGLLAVVGVSIFAATVGDVTIGTTVVAVFIAALGYGGYRAHKIIRGLGNFLTALASSILGLGFFALANLYIPWKEAGLADAYHSPYLFLSAFGTAVASLVLGWRFKIAGWFAIGPIGIGISMLIATFAYVPGTLEAAGLNSTETYAWTIVVVSLFTLLIGGTAPMLRLTIPEFKKPTDEEKYLVLDMTRERLFARQSVLMAMIVSAGLLTVRYAQVLFGVLTGGRPFGPLPIAPVLGTGLIWVAAALVIDRIGHRFTTSGQPNRLLQRGGWILGLSNLALVAGKLASDLGGYTGAVVASAFALVFLLLPRYIGAIRNSVDTAFATSIAGWSTWAVWWVATPGLLLGQASSLRILSIQFALMAFVWLAVRFVYATGKHQVTIIILAGLCAMLIPIGTATGQGMGPDVWQASGLLFLAAVVVTLITLANQLVNRRQGIDAAVNLPLVGTISHAAVATSTLVATLSLAREWSPTDAYLALPMVGVALVISVLRFASTARMANDNPLFASVKVGTAPYLLLALASPLLASVSGDHQHMAQTYSLTILFTTIVVVGFATLRRVDSYGRAGVVLAFALSVVVDYTVQHLVSDGQTKLPLAVGLGVFIASFVGIYVSYAKRLPSIAPMLGKATSVLFGGFSLIHAVMVNTGQRPGEWLVWTDSLTLVALGSIVLLFSRSKAFASMPGLPSGAVVTGWLSLAMAETAAFATVASGPTLGRVLAINAIAVATLLLARKNDLGAATNLVIYVATRAELVLALAFAITQVPSQAATSPLLPFAALALSYLIDLALARFAQIQLSWFTRILTLIGTLVLALPQLNWVLAGIDGARPVLATGSDWSLLAYGLTLASIAALLWRHLRKAADLRNFAEALLAWGYGMVLVGTSGHSHLDQPLVLAAWFSLLAVAFVSESFAARRQLTALVGFLPSLVTGWLLAYYLTDKFHIGVSSISSLVAVALFVAITVLARRDQSKSIPGAWAYVLPSTSLVGYIVGVGSVTSLAGGRTAIPAAGLVFDACLALVITVSYLRLANSKLWHELRNVRSSLAASAAVNWAFGLYSALNLENSTFTFVYLLATTAVVLWYGWTYQHRLAIFGIYVMGVVLAADADVAFGAQVNPSGYGLEFVTAILAAMTAIGTYVLEAKVQRFKGTLVRWAAPLGIVLVPSACYTIVTSAVSFAHQSSSSVTRFIAVSVISTVGVLVGIRIGNRGITTATTTSLMVALVPGLWYRIEDISTSPSITAETRALLVAVTFYVLVYIYRRNTHISLPSLVVWGVPVVISLSMTFIDAMNAVHRSLNAEDWIRFAILMSAGALFLVVGAMRRIAGMFYPGLLTVVVSVIPYAWSNGGYLFAVLLVIAGLIVWAAIRLDRFSGWLKALD